MPIQILYQDKNILVCVKEPGIGSEDELPEILREQCALREIYCVHRLDKAVGGVMVFALTKESASRLSAAVTNGRLHKEYYAVVQGRMEEPSGTMQDLLFHDSRKNKSYVVDRERKGVREAELLYEVLAEVEDCSLVKIRLVTGRTHQIRVQFASRKHPLLGDSRYGSPVKLPAIALWSRRLSFDHPVSRHPLRYVAEPPAGEPWDRFPCEAEISTEK